MTDNTIVCRARIAKTCYHGRAIAGIYPDGMEDDGTWNGESVVCDPCYIKGGQPSLRYPASRADVLAHIDGSMGLHGNDYVDEQAGLHADGSIDPHFDDSGHRIP